MNKELERLEQAYAPKDATPWLQWGPYLSERQWGTVREDYSAGGNAWDYFSHDQSRSRAYRWGEDGLAGISDPEQRLCFALALWNERDPILKERLFGLTNSEGNHGEDVKEYYYYVDNTPTHSYMKWLYKYPQAPFPYGDLVQENGRRKGTDSRAFEYELLDTGIFNDDRYFDVQVEYAKASADDILISIQVTNHGPDAADIVILPTLWCRNTWSWYPDTQSPVLEGKLPSKSSKVSKIIAPALGDDKTKAMTLYCDAAEGLLFADNETNNELLWGSPNKTPYPKDGINDHIVSGSDTVNPELKGSKASARYKLSIASGKSETIRLRLSANQTLSKPFGPSFTNAFKDRSAEADTFYSELAPDTLSEDQKMIQRQAYAGMLWSKQYFHYAVADWLDGDPVGPPPPPERDRNAGWRHMYASNVLSMPDAWEYPWFAAWDLCFQAIVFSRIDAAFAKNQLQTLAHEWYMSPNGAIPAYEWAFDDINPPLHAWAALRIFENEKEIKGGDGDTEFLKDIFRSCLMNFTWWANKVDPEGNNLFEGGFLGLDNISVLNRSGLNEFSNTLGRQIELLQADGTSWMGMFCLSMMEIALKLTKAGNDGYLDLAVMFFQHFVYIADALNGEGPKSSKAIQLWDEEDSFYYDCLKIYGDTDKYVPIKLRSLVGIIPLFPVYALDLNDLEEHQAKAFRERIDWFLEKHPELLEQSHHKIEGQDDSLLLSFVNPDRLKAILKRTLDQAEFLSEYGIRGISAAYRENPFEVDVEGHMLSEAYAPAESTDGAFGGNSNWRGPIWFPINYLLIERLKRYHNFLGDSFQIEYPSGSGNMANLSEISDSLSQRLVSIFEKDSTGKRPVYGGNETQQSNPSWQDLILYHEYFHGDNGAGLGASHQTGWTGLVAELLSK
ncbi:glucosidase [bacterium]|nr:glucosidase [bacterium]